MQRFQFTKIRYKDIEPHLIFFVILIFIVVHLYYVLSNYENSITAFIEVWDMILKYILHTVGISNSIIHSY